MERIRSNNDPMVDIHADDAVTKNEKRSSAAVRALLGFLGFVAALWLLVSLLGSFMHHPVASANTDTTTVDGVPAVTKDAITMDGAPVVTKDVKTTTTTIDTVPAPVNSTNPAASSTVTIAPMESTTTVKPEASSPTPPPAPEVTNPAPAGAVSS
ncbi:hypothetical protein [Bartonella sp. TP]|uniref:hypothetical protein n=1 Tax=Bartonella sp. TP TaxID=3057550 RepID=UPI0025AF3058|nr:hypothetical protein [Bartonella sp. TP]WJW80064.1 hypothetical protein QVL57_00400 [Bartonella sp. TP]